MLYLFDKQYNKYSNIVKYYNIQISVFYLNIFKNVFYSCNDNIEFSASLLESSVSHDTRNCSSLLIWNAFQETFLNIINVKNVFLLRDCRFIYW